MLRCALIGLAVKQMSRDLPEMPRLSAAATFAKTANTSASSSSCCTQTANVMQLNSRAHNSLRCIVRSLYYVEQTGSLGGWSAYSHERCKQRAARRKTHFVGMRRGR